MVSEEKKMELLKKIDEANKVLEKYGLLLNYGQYTADYSKPLEPHLFLRTDRKKELPYRLISLEVCKGEDESWDYNVPVNLLFYIGEFEFVAKNAAESVSSLGGLSDAMKDIKILNDLGLWLSKDLVSLQ